MPRSKTLFGMSFTHEQIFLKYSFMLWIRPWFYRRRWPHLWLSLLATQPNFFGVKIEYYYAEYAKISPPHTFKNIPIVSFRKLNQNLYFLSRKNFRQIITGENQEVKKNLPERYIKIKILSHRNRVSFIFCLLRENMEFHALLNQSFDYGFFLKKFLVLWKSKLARPSESS